MRRKLARRSGETLIETLVSVLIVTLASIVLVQAVLTSVQIGSSSGSADKAFSSALTAAEEQKSPAGSGTVTLSKDGTVYDSAKVQYYGAGSGGKALTSYSAGGAS